jgi:DNA invertase Pin-like site-specific DNA recombinase
MVQDQTAVISYIRISTEEQNSPDTQRAAIQRYCDYHGLKIVQEFCEVESGKSILIRPQLQAALACLGVSATGLVVFKLDRLSRSLHDITGMVEQYFKKFKLHAVVEKIDTGSAAGEFQINILGAVAQMERAQLADRTRYGLQHRKATGRTYCKRLYGWFVEAKMPMRPNPAEQAIIQDILNRKAQGWSLRQIIKHLDSRKVPPPFPERKGKPCKWHPQTIKEILERNKHATGSC